MVRVIQNANEIPRDQKVIVDFFATWCGPCKQIAPYYEQMAETFQEILFLKADVDDFHDEAGEFEVEVMPTFVLLNQGKKVAEIKGANINHVMKALNDLENQK